MLIFLDSANLDEIRKALQLFPIDGVTTNPTILSRTGEQDPAALLKEIRKTVDDGLLFAQVTSHDTDAIIDEAKKLVKLLGAQTVIKIPVTAATLEAMIKLNAKGIHICATAVYTVTQALMAAKAGAEYVAPYVSHIDGQAIDGPELAIRMQETITNYDLDTHVLGASFRTVSQVEKLMAGGVDSATVTFDMLEKLASSAGTAAEVDSFDRNWKHLYGDKSIGDFI